MDINSSSSREVALKQPILFDNFISDSGPDGALIYKDLDQHRSLVPFFTELLQDYAIRKKSKVDIVLFNYVIERITYILRIIKNPIGNAPFIGDGGKRNL